MQSHYPQKCALVAYVYSHAHVHLLCVNWSGSEWSHVVIALSVMLWSMWLISVCVSLRVCACKCSNRCSFVFCLWLLYNCRHVLITIIYTNIHKCHYYVPISLTVYLCNKSYVRIYMYRCVLSSTQCSLLTTEWLQMRNDCRYVSVCVLYVFIPI